MPNSYQEMFDTNLHKSACLDGSCLSLCSYLQYLQGLLLRQKKIEPETPWQTRWTASKVYIIGAAIFFQDEGVEKTPSEQAVKPIKIGAVMSTAEYTHRQPKPMLARKRLG